MNNKTILGIGDPFSGTKPISGAISAQNVIQYTRMIFLSRKILLNFLKEKIFLL